MSASLVGSEMCIRDRCACVRACAGACVWVVRRMSGDPWVFGSVGSCVRVSVRVCECCSHAQAMPSHVFPCTWVRSSTRGAVRAVMNRGGYAIN
eukprot:4301658-Alexandrium_andersonii.AAC.1